MKQCPQCQARFDDSQIFCTNDGVYLINQLEALSSRPKTSLLPYAVLGVAVLLSAAALVWTLQNGWKQSPAPANSVSEQELKLKEKELALQEKELELKRKEAEKGKQAQSNTAKETPPQTSTVVQNEKPLPPIAPPASGKTQRYSGSIGNLATTLNLSWNEKAKTVSGSYSYNNNPGVVYTLSGTNARDGEAEIAVNSGNRSEGTIRIYKNITGNKVCWSGTFYSSEGSSQPVGFCRYR